MLRASVLAAILLGARAFAPPRRARLHTPLAAEDDDDVDFSAAFAERLKDADVRQVVPSRVLGALRSARVEAALRSGTKASARVEAARSVRREVALVRTRVPRRAPRRRAPCNRRSLARTRRSTSRR